MTGSDLAPYSAPITKLIEVVAKGIGVIYEPTRIVREANAHARAELILAATDEKLLEIKQRAAARVLHTEILRQENIETVIEIAQKELPADVSAQPVEQDWINSFFAGVQDVSSEQLQSLWGKILAGEITSPGRYSRRLIEFLKTMNKAEAELVSAVLSITFRTKEGWPFYFSQSLATRDVMQSKVGNIGWETHLIDIGLVSSQEAMTPVSQFNGSEIFFGDSPLVMGGPTAPPEPTPNLRIPRIESWASTRDFTAIGQQLSRVASATVSPDLWVKISLELEQIGVWIRAENGSG